jgi:hypothetical protein
MKMGNLMLLLCILFVHDSVSGQNNKTVEAYYNQIPSAPDILFCDNSEKYTGIKSKVNLLILQIEESRHKLDAEARISSEKAYNELSAGFPSDEELKRIDKLSEQEQMAYWAKVEATQTNFDEAVANKRLKYQKEKEDLNQQWIEYSDRLLKSKEEFTHAAYDADKIFSDKRQIIYDTSIGADNKLTKSGEKQMEEIRIEHCSAVSSAYLKIIRLEYDFLKQNMFVRKRLTAIELIESGTLSEQEVYKRNTALFDLTEIEVLSQYLSSYRQLLDLLPGQKASRYESQ